MGSCVEGSEEEEKAFLGAPLPLHAGQRSLPLLSPFLSPISSCLLLLGSFPVYFSLFVSPLPSHFFFLSPFLSVFSFLLFLSLLLFSLTFPSTLPQTLTWCPGLWIALKKKKRTVTDLQELPPHREDPKTSDRISVTSSKAGTPQTGNSCRLQLKAVSDV